MIWGLSFLCKYVLLRLWLDLSLECGCVMVTLWTLTSLPGSKPLLCMNMHFFPFPPESFYFLQSEKRGRVTLGTPPAPALCRENNVSAAPTPSAVWAAGQSAAGGAACRRESRTRLDKGCLLPCPCPPAPWECQELTQGPGAGSAWCFLLCCPSNYLPAPSGSYSMDRVCFSELLCTPSTISKFEKEKKGKGKKNLP
uniref:Uncharacterized protein n=1 Tax=Molossus molossus TaxID=27622 RepID=A0A7J8G059_MOLMO|nr:hypothetical protein HJG59_008308 [Molossus molossus]